MRGAASLVGAVLLAGTALAVATSAYARKAPPGAWQVVRSSDPVTHISSCAVVASDYVGKLRFTQSGGLYPVVEMNSTYGLLVGVSSGGRMRMTTGNIVWAVDDLPYRELDAAENPATGASGRKVPQETVAAVNAQTLQMIYPVTATSTMASGVKAKEILRRC
jgi:hypothetical protein